MIPFGAPRLELSVDTMHLCPKPGCGRWYHESCLLRSYSAATISPSSSPTSNNGGKERENSNDDNDDPDDADFRCRHLEGLRRLASDSDSLDPHPHFVKFLYPARPVRGKSFSHSVFVSNSNSNPVDSGSGTPLHMPVGLEVESSLNGSSSMAMAAAVTVKAVKALKNQTLLNLNLNADAEDTWKVPDSLIRVASLPITRRAATLPVNVNKAEEEAEEKGNEEKEKEDLMTGNMRDVVLARRMVYQELEGDEEFLDELLERLEGVLRWSSGRTQNNHEKEEEEEEEEGMEEAGWWYTHLWAALSSQRILASAYVPYWDGLARKMDEKEQSQKKKKGRDKMFWCPRCSNMFVVAI